MKKITKLMHAIVMLFFLVSLGLQCNTIVAQHSPKTLKIGIYDSRIVTIAYSRSDYFNDRQMKMRKEGNEIMQSNDTAKMVEAFYFESKYFGKN